MHSTRNIRLAFFLNLIFTILEFIGGWLVNSVAILSDAIHDLGDSLSLGTAWYLQHKSKQKADQTFSFGYQRFSLLGALINSIVLIAGSVFVIQEAIDRLIHPEMADPTGMLGFAVIGVAVNGYAAWKMSSGKSLNERVVSWHLLEDVLGWVAVLIVAVIMHFVESPYLDPALSLAITAYVLFNVVKRLRETMLLFLQGKPKDINRDELEKRLLAIPHVSSIHHTHIWSLDGEHHVFTTHLELSALSDLQDILQVKRQVRTILNDYAFKHYTIQTEFAEEDCDLV